MVEDTTEDQEEVVAKNDDKKGKTRGDPVVHIAE